MVDIEWSRFRKENTPEVSLWHYSPKWIAVEIYQAIRQGKYPPHYIHYVHYIHQHWGK